MTEQVTTNEEPTITIDDVTHNLSDLSQEAQQCVSQITSLDKQVQATQFQLQQQSAANSLHGLRICGLKRKKWTRQSIFESGQVRGLFRPGIC